MSIYDHSTPGAMIPMSVSVNNVSPEEFNIETFQYVIQGQGLKISMSLTDSDVLMAKEDANFKEHIRKKLAAALAEKILQSKLCEVTQWDDPVLFTRNVGIRCYLVPNDHVKILRTHHANIQR